MKCRDVYRVVDIELGQRVTLSSLHRKARWSSMFDMTNWDYNLGRLLNATASGIEELGFNVVKESE